MLIKEMFMRSFENVEVLRQFINWLLWIYNEIMIAIFNLILILCVVSYIVFLVVSTDSNTKVKASLSNFKQHFRQWHESIKIRFTREKVIEISKNRFLCTKSYLWKCRHLLIWYVLVWSSRFFVTLGYWLIGRLNIQLPWWCSDAEKRLLWLGSLYTLILFIIASMVITFCFWNKFVRNIWIFIYILGICVLFVRWFLALWCPTV